ncbi:acyl-CoA thioesterase/BAAT N-terminal domain-containing protein [Williamsia serinedens]|uniref:Lysophospholipase, alpha-beta hydrolase superfamily n=1 Tax=Williamsia serinedens TaxID=391736 RepID=A0ABT1H4C4_9NOCA|nr:acyl-CoA thioesterase/bile acid-CoA:amino acid N-acyltransferase family protein [Williamsia serinedens]MCP2162094.1 Lysophospholipase, alpha-beta hydrolase superfamily [Williamsia serinedens]
MSFVLGFAPWILFWVLVGNTGFVVAVACATAGAVLAVALGRSRDHRWRSLDVGTAAVFVVLLIVALTVDDAVLERWLQPLGNLGLFLVALAGVLVGRPFVREYAADAVDEATARTDGFRAITLAMTWMWVGAFAVMTLVSFVPPLVDGSATVRDADRPLSVVCYWVIPFVVLGLAGAVSGAFPPWFDKQSSTVAARSRPATPVDQPPAPPDITDESMALDLPEESRHDDAFVVTVTGLDPDADVDLECAGVDLVGRRWTSSARFRASTDGTVDTGRDAPREGDWPVADPAAPIWAMRPESTDDLVDEMFVPPAEAWSVTVTIRRDGRDVLRRSVTRSHGDHGVRVEDVDLGGRPAVVARPPGERPATGWPVVLCFGGSEGGVDSQRSTVAMLASRGHLAVAGSWADEPTAPDEATVVDVPLERFTRALTEACALDDANPLQVVAIGISRGAEGLLAAVALAGSAIRDTVLSGLVLVSPSSVSWQAVGPDGDIPETPSWRWSGAPVPAVPVPTGRLMPQLVAEAATVRRDIARRRPSLLRLWPAYAAGLDLATDTPLPEGPSLGAGVPVPVLCIAGADDALWPSARMAHALVRGRGLDEDRLVVLPGAGHLIRFGEFPTAAQWTGGIAFGGDRLGQALGQRAAREALLAFLARVTA